MTCSMIIFVGLRGRDFAPHIFRSARVNAGWGEGAVLSGERGLSCESGMYAPF